jgi:hypothetical protein
MNKYLNHILKDTSDQVKPKLIGYPTVAYAPETSWEFGLSMLFVYRAKQDIENRLSEVSLFTFFTLEQQYGGYLEHTLYTDQNKYFFLGQWKFQDFPLSYHGIGMDTPNDKTALVSAKDIRIRERALRQIIPSLYTGFEVNFERLSDVDFEIDQPQTFMYPRGAQGSTNLSLGWGVVYDDIHNVLNPREGHFGEIAFLTSNKSWGSTNDFNLGFVDFRLYMPSLKNNVLAFQIYNQFGNKDIPFNELALMGGERMMRGYYLGRYRDNNYSAAQAEYRFLPFSFAKRWGAAFFVSAGTVYPDFSAFDSSPFVWAVGGGPRFLLFPKKDIYNRVDVAFTPEGYGIYFFIGESF